MYRKSRPSRGSLNSISFVLETKFSYSSDETIINKLNIKKLNDFIFSFPSGKSGQKTFPSKRFLARGGQVEEGVTVATYRSTYFWEPVQHTNFTVTIVVKDGDKDETLDTQTIPSGKPKHHWKRCKLSERYWPTLCLFDNDWPYRSLNATLFCDWIPSRTCLLYL